MIKHKAHRVILLETERTIMRVLTVMDAREFFELNNDPEVLRFTGDEPFPDIERAADFLENYDQYVKFGVGRLAVIEKATSRFVGWCGVRYSADRDEYDIGFRFFREYWGRGFATETSLRILQLAFREMGINELVGRCMKRNIASIKVLEKIGMEKTSTVPEEGNRWVIYRLKRC